MILQTRNPAGEGGAADFDKALGRAFVCQQITFSTTENLAADVIARRFGLRPHVARLICELAALGGRCA